MLEIIKIPGIFLINQLQIYPTNRLIHLDDIKKLHSRLIIKPINQSKKFNIKLDKLIYCCLLILILGTSIIPINEKLSGESNNKGDQLNLQSDDWSSFEGNISPD
jgi:hypothetical protein